MKFCRVKPNLVSIAWRRRRPRNRVARAWFLWNHPEVGFGMSGLPSTMTLSARPTPRSTVGLLDSFERGLERAVNGAFAKTFRSGVQPVEIVAALRREMDTMAQVIGRDRILAPNSYEVLLSRA